MLNKRALYYLSAIKRRGSLRRAAASLGVDVSTVSRKIRQLEETLDTCLLERGATGAVLTEAGKMLAVHHHIQEASDAATLSRLSELQGVVSGRVRIGLGEGFVPDLVLEPARAFMETRPQVNLEIIVSGVVEATELLKSGEVDLALLYAPPVDHQLQCHVETIQPIDLIVPAGHRFATGSSPSFKDIFECPVGLMDSTFGIRQMVNAVAHQERVAFEARLLTNSVTVLRHFVSSGSGVSFMPELTVSREILEGKMVSVPLDHIILNSTRAQIVSLAGREMTVATKSCLEHLRQGMRFFQTDAPRLSKG